MKQTIPMPAHKADAKIEHLKLSDVPALVSLFQPGKCPNADALLGSSSLSVFLLFFIQ